MHGKPVSADWNLFSASAFSQAAVYLKCLAILGAKDGLNTFWYETGQKEDEVNFIDGQKEGLQTQWHEDGWKQAEQNFKEGKEHGLALIYDKDGKEIVRQNWRNGVLVFVKKVE